MGAQSFATSVGQPSMGSGQVFAAHQPMYSGGPQGAPQTLTPDGAAAGSSVRGTVQGAAGDRRLQSNMSPMFSVSPGNGTAFGPTSQGAMPQGCTFPGAPLGGSSSGLAGNWLQHLDANASPPPQTRTVGSAFELFGKPFSGSMPSSQTTPSTPAQQNELMLKALTAALSGDKKSIPTWNGSVETLRPWLRQLSYWELDNNVPKTRWGIKLLQSFTDGSAPRKIAETVDLSVVLSEQGYGTILTEIMTKYGPFLEAIGPAAIDHFFYGFEGSRQESFSNYIAAKEVALQELEAQLGEKVPPRIAGRVLLRGANLSEQQRENLAIKYNALLTFDQIARALRPLDRPEALVGKVSKTFLMGRSEATEQSEAFHEGEHEDLEEEEELLFEEDEPESDGEGNLTYLVFDPSREYTEEETQYIWAYNSAYRDVRKDLQARRKGRQFFKPKDSAQRNKKGGGKGRFGKSRSFSKGRQPDRQNKGSPGDLLAKTRCFRCDELGHMSKDCPKRDNPSSSFFVVQGNQGTVNRTFVVSGRAAAITPESVASSDMDGTITPDTPCHASQVFVNIASDLQRTISVLAGVRTDGHEAVVDTAAEEAVIGSSAMQRLTQALARHGLQPRPASGATVTCSGIGGSAKILGIWDIPIGVCRSNGLIRATEIEDSGSFETPFLLPVSYQELVGAVIDLDRSTFKLRNGRKTMMKRTVCCSPV